MLNINILNNQEISSLRLELASAVDLYNAKRNEFVSAFGLQKYESSELALKSIWSCYIAHNLKDYGDGPTSLRLDKILSAPTIMCSQYSTLAVYVLHEFGVPDSILRPIGWENSPIGNHSQLLCSTGEFNFIIDPTVGLIVDGVTDSGLIDGLGYNDYISFRKSDNLNWYSDKILKFYSSGHYNISNLVYLADGYYEWTNNLSSAFAFNIDSGGIHYIFGSSTSENLAGTSSCDVIYGRDGNDVLVSSGRGDKLFGGSGNDKYFVSSIDTVVSEIVNGTTGNDSGGIDKIFSSVSYRLPNFVESITLTGNRSINALGNSLNNTINGNNGDNKLTAGLGADVISGGGGADTIFLGNDFSRDICKYLNPSDSTMEHLDFVVQFKIGVDKIDLSSIDSNIILDGNNQFSIDQIIARPNSVWTRDVGNNLYIHADTSGDLIPEITICLVGISSVNNHDVLL